MFNVFSRWCLLFLLIAMTAYSCKDKKEDPVVIAIEEDSDLETNAANADFFPVTNYFRGQVYEITNSNINPLMITNDGFKVDSVWLKTKDFEKAISTFLEPVIDSANLKEDFTQTSFKDATLNKITFTYTPTIMHPAGHPLKSWNLYIDPQTNEISGIYILKVTPGKGTEHLNWIAGKKCSIQLLKDDMLVFERNIIWNFDENE